jgi:hypothetical protein
MEHIDWSFGAGSKLVLKQINRIKRGKRFGQKSKMFLFGRNLRPNYAK